MTFIELRKADIFKIKRWRNQQMGILRQNRKLTNTDQLKWWKSLRTDESQRLFAIRDGKTLLGYCGLVHIDKQNRNAEMSFLLDTKITEGSRKFGVIATHAYMFLEGVAFFDMNLNRVYTECYSTRTEMLEILDAIFTREGTLRENVWKDGKPINSVIHAHLKPKPEGKP